jgi:hypothetical protein
VKELMRPRARTRGLVVERLAEETLVYDLERHRAHCLNRTASLVWEACNGRNNQDRIARHLSRLRLPASAALVETALCRLHRAHLLEPGSFLPPSGAERLTRREAVRRLGIAAALVPAVTGIVAPMAQAAATCLIDVDAGRPCAPSQCGRECGGPPNCGTGQFLCKNLGGGNYRCVPNSAGSCP